MPEIIVNYVGDDCGVGHDCDVGDDCDVGTDWYLIVLGRKRASLVVTWWCWSVLGDTGSKHGGTGCQCDMLSENIWFTWSKPTNH